MGRALEQQASGQTPRVDPRERIYAIGDIHGCFDLLVTLLRKIERDAARFEDDRAVRLVFLGDYIDRGPASREVLAALTELCVTDGIVALAGNHEAAMMEFLTDPERNADWLDFGGVRTLESLGISAPRNLVLRSDIGRVRDELQDALAPYHAFLANLFRVHRSGDVIFSHAGLDPRHAWDSQHDEALLWGCPEVLTEDPLPGRLIVHGHFDDVLPVLCPGRICVDTGAYYSGRLTAVRLDDGQDILTVTR